MIAAKILTDSINPEGERLTTMLLTMPRIVLAEFNTHRVFSRNSASSRAIPFERMIEKVQLDPFVPVAWLKQHKGMQGHDYITDEKVLDEVVADWLRARDDACKQAVFLSEAGVTKQVVNRLLEPFLWHHVIATASDRGWSSFLAQRAHPDAEIHIQRLAYCCLEALNGSKPNHLYYGKWHLPFYRESTDSELPDLEKVKLSVARCARVSYDSFDGTNSLESDLKLYERLVGNNHWSPLEHQAKSAHFARISNFGNCHWHQYRKSFDGEFTSDPRLLKKG